MRDMSLTFKTGSVHERCQQMVTLILLLSSPCLPASSLGNLLAQYASWFQRETCVCVCVCVCMCVCVWESVIGECGTRTGARFLKFILEGYRNKMAEWATNVAHMWRPAGSDELNVPTERRAVESQEGMAGTLDARAKSQHWTWFQA